MSHTDSDTLITISSSFNSGGDVSKDPMQTEAYAPHKEIESQHPDLPDDWKPPSQPFARFCFTQLCWITLRKPDLEELWQEVNQKDSWYNRAMRLDVLERHSSNQLLNILACAVTVLTLPTSIENTDRTSKEYYEVMLLLSPPLMVVGLLCHFYVVLLLIIGGKELRQFLTPPRKMVVLSYLLVFRTTDILFAIAWAFLGTCGFITLLGVNPVNYWIFTVGSCTLVALLDAAFKRNVRAMTSWGVVAFILWSAIALGYFQRSYDDY